MKSKKFNVLGLITARGGSKRLPGKNLMSFKDKPLIAWTIEAGLESKSINRLALSSDDPEICEIAKKYGCDVPFLRPDHLSTDEASSVDVVYHALEILKGYTHVVLLQPTSPLRNSHHIDEAFEKLLSSKATACVSVKEAIENPFWMQLIDKHGYIRPVISNLAPVFKNNQKAYIPNGAIYISEIKAFYEKKSFYGEDTLPYVMSRRQSIDIDTYDDFKMALENSIDK